MLETSAIVSFTTSITLINSWYTNYNTALTIDNVVEFHRNHAAIAAAARTVSTSSLVMESTILAASSGLLYVPLVRTWVQASTAARPMKYTQADSDRAVSITSCGLMRVMANTAETLYFAVRSPRFWVSGYCTEWRKYKVVFDSSYSRSSNERLLNT